jgi:hypothetical protein
MSSKRQDFIIVSKDAFKTRFLQDADMFEPFKFIGQTVVMSGIFTKSIDEVLRRMAAIDMSEYEVVGLIVPNQESVFFENHKVISDGTQWGMVEDLCNAYRAPLRTVSS